MPEKQKTRNWKDPKTIIATVSIATILTLWNTFAAHDRHRTGVLKLIAFTPSTPSQTKLNNVCAPTLHAPNRGTRCMTVTSTRSS